MKQTKRAYLALFAAVVGMPFFAGPASAQMRVDTGGHALDANPQAGSGGYNTSTPQTNYSQYNNAITTFNTTNGFGFRGHNINGVNLGVGYSDPFAFRGLLAGQGVDQFIANSTGVPTMANPSAASANYAAPSNPGLQYYGASNHVSAPAGFQQLPNAQGYIPQQPMVASPQDPRLGAVDFSGSGQILPKPYELNMPGPVDPTANPATTAQQMLAVNPLFGVVNWSMTPQPLQDQTQASQQLGQSPLQQGVPPAIAQGLTLSQVAALRQELLNNSSSSAIGNPNQSSNSSALAPLRPGGEDSNADQPLGSLYSQSSQLKASNLAPIAGDVSTDQSSRNYPVDISLPPPGQQSAQFGKLRKSLDDYNSKHPLTDEEANRNFQQILKMRNQASVNVESGANVISGPGAVPGNPDVTGIPNPEQSIVPGPGVNLVPGNPNSKHLLKPGFNTLPNMGGSNQPVSPAPVPIPDFSSGFKSKGMSDLMATGELSVQHGKYDDAITTYNQAIDVAPNNPLILMARAMAELGGGYYAQANADIHVAVAEDPAVLMGQYDLEKHLGAAKLNSLLADLKEIAKNTQDDTMHAFLLTFAYYNSHHIGQAAEWLQNTDRRTNGQDPAILQMKKYWNFSDEVPASTPPAVAPLSPQPKSVTPSTRPSGGK